MTAREVLHSIIDNMTEQQVQNLLMQIGSEKDSCVSTDILKGALSEYANPELVSEEHGAWERAVVKSYENT